MTRLPERNVSRRKRIVQNDPISSPGKSSLTIIGNRIFGVYLIVNLTLNEITP